MSAKATKPGVLGRPVFSAKKRGEPYRPGVFDTLLAPREHPRTEEVASITLEITPRGLALTEHTIGGQHPKSYLRAFPYSTELLLLSGERLLVEIHSLGCDDQSLRGSSDLLSFSPLDEDLEEDVGGSAE